MHIWVDGHEIDGDHKLTPEERARLRAEIEKARAAAHDAMEKARPEIEKARAEARAAMEKARPEMERAMQEVRRHRAEIARAEAEMQANQERMRELQPKIDAAMAQVEAHRAEIEQAVAQVQPQLDAALAKVRADLAAQHIDARIQEHVDQELKRVELRIEMEEARDRSRADQAVHRNITIHTTEQPNGDRTEERTETDGK
jgi:hypothetical protein